jgi:hypothetical protein
MSILAGISADFIMSAGAVAAGADLYAIFVGAADREPQPEKAPINSTRTPIAHKKYRIPHLLSEK